MFVQKFNYITLGSNHFQVILTKFLKFFINSYCRVAEDIFSYPNVMWQAFKILKKLEKRTKPLTTTQLTYPATHGKLQAKTRKTKQSPKRSNKNENMCKFSKDFAGRLKKLKKKEH